jgi:hypothetical protein
MSLVTSVVLEEWRKVKRLQGLTDAQVQMGLELKINPGRLLASARVEQGPTQPSLAQLIEDLYHKRFEKALPDSVVPLRQALHEARARERAEARERRRRKRQSERDHLEAMRVSMLTIRSLYGGPGANEDL